MSSQAIDSPARLLWDSGGIWSVLAGQALCQAGLSVQPISAAQIRAGELQSAGLLMVPGGWSSQKKKALGPEGCKAVRQFVRAGGFYLGLCGGAGLALGVEDGLGLLPLGRVSGQSRLAAVSGPVMVEPSPGAASLPWWQGLGSPARFWVWWPGQFAQPQDNEVRILASYTGAAPGLCSSDLEADQVRQGGWDALESQYGCNLNPGRLAGLPAVLSGDYGKGKVLISYLHFDTPGDPNGALVLQNLWQEVLGISAQAPAQPAGSQPDPALAGLAARARELWNHGKDLGLWRSRTPPALFPLWKRRSRGLEFFSLLYLVEAAASLAGNRAQEAAARLEPLLEPVYQDGPQALAQRAASLAGKPGSLEGAQIHSKWFPRPRRTGGDLASALQGLEKLLATLL